MISKNLPLFFWFDLSLDARAEMCQKILVFFGKIKTPKFYSEVTRPLVKCYIMHISTYQTIELDAKLQQARIPISASFQQRCGVGMRELGHVRSHHVQELGGLGTTPFPRWCCRTPNLSQSHRRLLVWPRWFLVSPTNIQFLITYMLVNMYVYTYVLEHLVIELNALNRDNKM